MDIKVRRYAKESYYTNPWTEFDGWLCGDGPITVTFQTNNRDKNSRFVITISDFEALALEMINANPEKAIKAFSAATVKAFSDATQTGSTAAPEGPFQTGGFNEINFIGYVDGADDHNG
jgi:hypothetical protein